MNPKLTQSFRAFRVSLDDVPRDRAASVALPLSDPGTVALLAGLADHNYSILIRGLLDRCAVSEDGSRFTWPGSSAAYVLALEGLEDLRGESAEKFREFRDKWRKRLAFPQLFPFLQRNQWIVDGETGFSLAGKGMRKDSKILYLQTLHDMASDAERQVSSLSGRVFRLQGELAEIWNAEAGDNPRARLLPALESALRPGETELFKRARLSLGDLALDTFVASVNRWETRVYPSEGELFRNIAWHWADARGGNGFEGFMEAFADLAEALSGAMIDHYAGKWELFLRGISPGWEPRGVTLADFN